MVSRRIKPITSNLNEEVSNGYSQDIGKCFFIILIVTGCATTGMDQKATELPSGSIHIDEWQELWPLGKRSSAMERWVTTANYINSNSAALTRAVMVCRKFRPPGMPII
jgi:hypothetical protein